MNVLKQRPYPRSQPQRQANQRPMSQRPNMNRNGSNGGQRPGQKRPDSRIYKPHKQYAGTIDTLKKVIATCFISFTDEFIFQAGIYGPERIGPRTKLSGLARRSLKNRLERSGLRRNKMSNTIYR